MKPKDSLEEKILKEFDKKANLFVGKGGWASAVDNSDGYGIWPENYNEVKSFLKSALKRTREQTIEEILRDCSGGGLWRRVLMQKLSDD